MNIDPSQQSFRIFDGNKLRISSRDGRNIATIPLDASFIKEKLLGAPESTGSDLAAAGWTSISVNVSGGAASKTYLISINQLQGVVDREEAARDQAVMDAAKHGLPEIVRKLLEDGATISDESRGWAVRFAAMDGHVGIVTQLLANGARISEDHRGLAIIAAARGRHAEIVTQLLANGATISVDHRGAAVLAAARDGQAGIVTQLLANGATIPADRRTTAAQAAARRGHAEIVTLLEGLPAAEPQAFARTILRIDPEDFANHPELFLANVAEDGLPLGVIFMNANGSEQPGIDGGGLTKQFVCQLAEHLLVKRVIETDELRFPRSSKEDYAPYTQLGKLMSYITQANAIREESLFIGEIFHPETYALLQILARPQDASESAEARKDREFTAIANAIASPATQTLVDFVNKQAPSEGDMATMKAYLEGAGVASFEGIAPAQLKDELRKSCFNCLAVKEYHKPMSAILDGLSPALKSKILAQGAAMASKLQGEINHRLLDKFTLTSQSPVVAEKLAWIKEKITSELQDPEKVWIKRFLKAVTSQSVMPTGSIVIRETSEIMCHSHTCFCQLDLPKDSTSKELFFDRLELLMAEEGFGLS